MLGGKFGSHLRVCAYAIVRRLSLQIRAPVLRYAVARTGAGTEQTRQWWQVRHAPGFAALLA